jgi:hypothetical protein
MTIEVHTCVTYGRLAWIRVYAPRTFAMPLQDRITNDEFGTDERGAVDLNSV